MNNVSLIGRVSHQPELRYTTSGTAVCEIDIAVDRHDDTTERIPARAAGGPLHGLTGLRFSDLGLVLGSTDQSEDHGSTAPDQDQCLP